MREQFISTIGNGLKDMDWSVLGDATRLNAGLSLPSKQEK
jgi:hypothetical protein